MFYYVEGKAALVEQGLCVIDCAGVGYACHTSQNTLSHVRQGEVTRLYTYLHVREDIFDLYGFIDQEELSCFKLLIGVSGVGPKAALAILSAGGPQNFTLAVMTGDEKMLTAAQGVGKKIAQRIILELKDKVGGSDVALDFSGVKTSDAPVVSSNSALASAALQELGYSASEISAALKGCDPKATTEEMVRYALRAMVMKG